MYSFLRIANQSDYPAISVLADDRVLVGQILQGEISSVLTLSAGSLSLIVRQHTERPFLNLWVSVPPEARQTLIIKNDTAYFAD